MTANLPERLEGLREAAPVAIGQLTRILCDNPRAFVLIAAGTMVTTKILANAMKPRTVPEAVALFIVANALQAAGLRYAIQRGWLEIRVRDEDGQLVPFRLPDGAAASL